MLAATVSVVEDETTRGNPVEGRIRVASDWAIAVTSELVPSTTMLVPRVSSKAASGLIVSEAGAGTSCGPVKAGRGRVGAGDGTVVQAAKRSVAEK
jgi:hypothetical protein